MPNLPNLPNPIAAAPVVTPVRSLLEGLTVLICRPREQAQHTAAALESAGAKCLIHPAIEVVAIDPTGPEATAIHQVLAKRDQCCWAIFTSANAVQFGWPWIVAQGGFPAKTQIIAIGAATAAALGEKGVTGIVTSDSGSDSEAILALPALCAPDLCEPDTVKNQEIFIFRGKSVQGGRPVLAATLSSRGYKVSQLECYIRRPATWPEAERIPLINRLWAGDVHALSVQSVETFDALLSILETPVAQRALSGLTILVPHSRIAEVVKARGFPAVAVTGIGDHALVEALVRLKPQLMMKNFDATTR